MFAGRPTTAALWGVAAVCALAQALHPPHLPGIDPVATSALLVALAMGALATAGALLQQAPTRATLGLQRGTLSLPRIAALAVGTLGLSQLLNTLLVESGLRPASELVELVELEGLLSQAGASEYALILVAFAIGPGIAEEILFRGLLLRGLAGTFGSVKALLGSSLLFGMAHSGAAESGAAAVLGLYLGAIALKGGGVRACVVCHIANNIAAVTWPILCFQPDSSAEPVSEAIVLAASLAATAVGLAALATPHRRRRRGPERNSAPST